MGLGVDIDTVQSAHFLSLQTLNEAKRKNYEPKDNTISSCQIASQPQLIDQTCKIIQRDQNYPTTPFTLHRGSSTRSSGRLLAFFVKRLGLFCSSTPKSSLCRIILMNCEVCQLKELEVEHFQIREVLQCILHTIVFHRALGLVRPRDIDLELFDITYVQCGDMELEKKIDDKIEQFISWVEKHPNKKSQICLSFYEVKNKHASWFSNKIERLYWEQWYINLNVAQHPKAHSSKSVHSKVVDTGEGATEDRNARSAALEASLREVLFQIIKFVNEKKDHVPPIPNLEGAVSFPYEISIPSSSDSAFGMDMIKRMLQTGHPTMLS